MTTNKANFEIYLNTPGFPVQCIADLIVVEEHGTPKKLGFRYRQDYLAHPGRFAIDPACFPLNIDANTFVVHRTLPGFLDDYLPDDWGRKVLAHLAFYRNKKKLNSNSVIDTLAHLGLSRIGALRIVPRGEAAEYTQGAHLSLLESIEATAYSLDAGVINEATADEIGMLLLSNDGSGVGGARPKALLHDDTTAYLGKFNRWKDPYNNARVELACLNMARAAGITVGAGRVISGINGREVLLIERFDIGPANTRYHLVTLNSFKTSLVQPASKSLAEFVRHGGIFRYDDIVAILRHYSQDYLTEADQLLRLMLFNSAIHNTDDHERNVSFIYRDGAYRLAPAYDLVPSISVGEYHALGYQQSPNPPRPSEIMTMPRPFGLPKGDVARAAEAVAEVVGRWQDFADDARVSEADTELVARVLRP